MNPIENEKFSYDFQKFVLQDPNVRMVNIDHPIKPFNLEAPKKADKSKKNKDGKDAKKKEEGDQDPDKGSKIIP